MIVVTGARGMLGRYLCSRLNALHPTLGVSRTAEPSVLACDVSDPKALEGLFAKHHPMLVIHAAAYSDVDGCEKNPGQAFASNTQSNAEIARACAKHKCCLISISTDYVFNGQSTRPYLEEDRRFPTSIYGATKMLGEDYTLSIKDSIVIRTSWLFGPGQEKNFVNMIDQKIKAGENLSVLRDQTSSPTSVADLAQVIYQFCELIVQKHTLSETLKKNRVIHVCNQGQTTRYEMAMQMKKILGSNVKLQAQEAQEMDRPALRPAFSCLSTKRLADEFGIRLPAWQTSLAAYLEAIV